MPAPSTSGRPAPGAVARPPGARPQAPHLPRRVPARRRQRQDLRAAVGAGSFDAAASLDGGGDPAPAEWEERFQLPCGLMDYYEMLGVDDDAPPAAIKKAYRALVQVCHPDFLGDDGHNMCVLLNEAYEVLTDPEQRAAYNAALDDALAAADDADAGFAPDRPLSKWCANVPSLGRNADPAENRAAFVDEVACIGCKQCVWVAQATFRIEPEHGRSRVFAQWVDTEADVQAAMDACPVSCIHWVQKEDLPALEYVTRHRLGRTNVGLMMAGQGGAPADVWAAAAAFLKERERRAAARAQAARRATAAQAARAAGAAGVARARAAAGWWAAAAERVGLGGAADALAGAYDALGASVMASVSSADEDDEFAGLKRVGRRRRAGGYGAPGGAGGARVPAERALVPAAARPRWQR